MRRKPTRPEAARLHGLVVLAKPAGPSSNRELQRLRRALGGVKAGHAGTLDPGAAGVLLVGIGEGAKLMPFLAGLAKQYRGRARFGAETDTQDGAGSVTVTAPWEGLGRESVAAAMAAMEGTLLQEPPMYSAVKVRGERLYRLARSGREVERPPRRVSVRSFELLAWDPPEAEFLVTCGGGTYVRTLVRDLGRRLGSAAHLAALERTAVGPFRIEAAVTVEQVAARPAGAAPPGLVRLADALGHLPAATVGAAEAGAVRAGRAPAPPPAAAPGELLRLLDGEGRLLAVARGGAPGGALELVRVFSEP